MKTSDAVPNQEFTAKLGLWNRGFNVQKISYCKTSTGQTMIKVWDFVSAK